MRISGPTKRTYVLQKNFFLNLLKVLFAYWSLFYFGRNSIQRSKKRALEIDVLTIQSHSPYQLYCFSTSLDATSVVHK